MIKSSIPNKLYKKIIFIFILFLSLLAFLGINYKNYGFVHEVLNSPTAKIYYVKIAKVAIPLKNIILFRNLNDKIALLKSSGSCVFCNLNQADFEGNNLKNVDLRYANLIGANLSNTNFSGAMLRHANLTGADLTNASLFGTSLNKANLTQSNLSGVDLKYRDLTGVNLSGVDLSNMDLTGVDLTNGNLTGVNLSGTNLSKSNLTGVDLSNKDLTGTNLTYAILTGANLYGVDLSNKDLTGVNLSDIDLSNKDLTGSILKNTKKIKIAINNPSNSNWPNKALEKYQNHYVSRYDLDGDIQYLTTRAGLLFEAKNNEPKLVLDLNKNSLSPFYDNGGEGGLLGVASQNDLVYIAYTSRDFINELTSLIVDEYSLNFTKVRNIFKIDGFISGTHFAGNLLLDSRGLLYLSVGEGGESEKAQDLSSLKGKILRLDVSESKLEPEIIAYGMRNPWGGFVDSKDRMFVLQCGAGTVESVFLIDDLYSETPSNFGWPIFEGSMRQVKDPLMLRDVSTPIFETRIRPGCVTGGVYLNDIESFLFTDFYGTIRLIKQQENGDWYLVHEHKQDEHSIWGLGLDKKTKKIFIAPSNLELEILIDQIKLN